MKPKTKMYVANVLMISILVTINAISIYLFPSDFGIVLGLSISVLVIAIACASIYPKYLGDYIEEFWKKQEEKNDKKKDTKKAD